MNKKFPYSFISAWSEPGVKAAFITDEQPAKIGGCENCGGWGFFATFIATDGPFNSPTDGRYDNATFSFTKVNHFYDGKWWVGTTISDKCPVCNGNGEAPKTVASTYREMAERTV
jgi:hypothetical protein